MIPLGHTNLISSSSGIFAQKVGTTNEIFFKILLFQNDRKPERDPLTLDRTNE